MEASRRREEGGRARFFLALAAALALALAIAQLFIAHERERLVESWRREVDATAANRSEVARLWFFERRADAQVLAHSPLTSAALAAAAAGDRSSRTELTSVLDQFRVSYGYTETYVLSADLSFVAGAPALAPNPSVRALARRTLASQHAQVVLVDTGEHVAFSAPVVGAAPGVVILEMDPRTELHPRLTGLETTSTGETLLVGTLGSDLVFASPRRHGSDPTRPLLVPPPLEANLAAGVAVTGQSRVGEFVDYRKAPVLAATRGIDVPGWGIVTKIDRAEALSPLGSYSLIARSLAALAVLALTSLGAAARMRARARSLSETLERQRGELELRRVEERTERLGRALDESNEEIYILDASSLEILETNARARRATLYDAERLGQLSLARVSPATAEGEIAEQLAGVSSGQRDLASFSTTHRRADGTSYPVDVRVHRAEIGERPVLVVLAADATARLELEAQLVQAQKMEAVGRLAGGVAHDFNNLLTLILMASESLKSSLEPGPARDDAAEIVSASKRAAELTRQLLSFSRKQTLQPVVVDANEVVRGLVRLLQRALRADVELELELGPEPAWLRVDRAQLEQALLNLTVNARDAMPQGGRLMVTVTHRDSATAPPGAGLPAERCVAICVRDNGEGMDAETMAHVFEPFFTTKPRGAGTGLGLAMVYGFVKQSGGAAQVTSRVGEGTCFELQFPACSAPAPAASAPSAVRSEGGARATILVVDDSPDVRNVAARVLRAEGFAVLVAPDGPEAIELFEAHTGQIDLLLTDVVMPKMGGRAVADALRQRVPGLRVLFMSGYNEDSILADSVGEAREAFLPKPFTPGRLLEAVGSVLDGGTARAPG
ncbi:MAG: response regulator [Polyangiaceae bacterium]|nr:response regulator [Polyangiaceae bacterium]